MAMDRYGNKPQVKILPDQFNHLNAPIIRTAIEFRAFGNFASVMYSYKGKKYTTLNYELVEE
jgi:hypothetical protein